MPIYGLILKLVFFDLLKPLLFVFFVFILIEVNGTGRSFRLSDIFGYRRLFIG
jgi:hypothetical protein